MILALSMELSDITKPAVIISKDASFKEAISMMVKEKTNSLLVIDESGVLVGEVSVSDLLDAIVPEYLDGDSIASEFAPEELFAQAVETASDTKVSEFMDTKFVRIHTPATLMLVAQLAIASKNARIPVVNKDEKPVGIISRRGLKHLIANYLHLEDSN
ncbi:CBS domain-containing protein [Candidatus Kaiserbacteria bacterium]|nr:CBS domain-containing protein [Candidatus Kaiserbacteria bacterium]